MSNMQVNIVSESKPMPKLLQKNVSASMLQALRKLEYGRWLTSDDTNIYPRTLESLYHKGFVERGILESNNIKQEDKVLYRLTEKGHKFINLYDQTPMRSRGHYFFQNVINSVRN